MCCFCISKDTGAALDPPTPKFKQIDPDRKAKLDPPDQSPTTIAKVETASGRLRSDSTDTTFSYASSCCTTQLSREVSEPVGGPTILAFMRGIEVQISSPEHFPPYKIGRDICWQITPRIHVERKGRFVVTWIG
jgi:hypothetical protein